MHNARKKGFHSYFDLARSLGYRNSMVLFDSTGKLNVYNSTKEIAKVHFVERKLKYKQRHAFLLTKMEARVKFITNKARFIVENIEKKMTVMNRKKKDVIQTLVDRKYDSDPVKAWKVKIARESGIEIDDDEGPAEDTAEDPKADFDYLLKMPIYNLTFEQKEKLLKEKGTIEAEHALLLEKTPDQLWIEDLDLLMVKLDELEKLAENTLKSSAKAAAKKGVKGGKGMSIEPSKDGEYVEAIVTEEMKKKILVIPRGKKAETKPKKEIVKKEVKAKTEVKQEANESDDSISKVKKTKSGKNPWDTDSEGDNDQSDNDMSDDVEVIPKRAPAKKRPRGISSDTAVDDKPTTKKTMKQCKF